MTTTLGDLIRSRRENRQESQVEVAKAAGIGRAYLCDLELGNRKAASDETIKALAEALNCNSDDLFVAVGRIPPDLRPLLPSFVRFARGKEWK